MSARSLLVDAQRPDPATMAEAAALLREGNVVAFPTETVYGLGADALNADAVARIYVAKGRPAWNPVIAHAPDIEAARALTRSWPESAERLAQAFWPGPLTLVLPRASHVPDIVTAGLDAVGVRVPAHPVALALLRATGRPIAAPSANRFTQVSPTTAAHVQTSLGDRIPLILDGGPCEVGIESTVVDLTSDTPTVLRPGMISRRQLEAVLGRPVALSVGSVRADDASTSGQRSPGMADRHYAPHADVWLFASTQRGEIERALTARQRSVTSPGGPVVALLLGTTVHVGATGRVVPMPDDPQAYARALYAELHAADADGASLVIIEQPPEDDQWRGVHDRLVRAAR
ncbi:MAG: threonylcarbamoyl-AMP synthase [Gemmatimonadaceae bacterium]|jgi:L-threonylcarbamoyladenylate synthase|nr:threonylcarbamoyl-AMP synthase [Gemmatimonadaceae bacterium]MCC6430893.1 threonylcarbamoyl-AMP synthase [Gemmatimonadaceae bacterium]